MFPCKPSLVRQSHFLCSTQQIQRVLVGVSQCRGETNTLTFLCSNSPPLQVRQAVSKLIVFTAHFAVSDPASPVPACLSNIPVEVRNILPFTPLLTVTSRSPLCPDCRITYCWRCWPCCGWRCPSTAVISHNTSTCSHCTQISG